MNKIKNTMNQFKGYMRRTWKNKVIALAMLGLGLLGTIISKDGTALVFMSMFAIPTFFTKEENFIE